MRTTTIWGTLAVSLLLRSLAWAQPSTDYAMFDYTGRVRVQGQPYNGHGQFKLAIINMPGTVTLWSNDFTSQNAGEPVEHITVPVIDGVFSILVGDTGLGMNPIHRTVFNSPGAIKLRVWFSDGIHGFEHLIPDKDLINVDLLGGQSGDTDFTLYVNGATGNDDHDGLTTATAKRTIQGAVDVLPARIRSNATVRVAPGTYAERVMIYGITVRPDKALKLIGDDAWMPASGGAPAVRITGTDDLTTPTIGREAGLEAHNVFGLEVVGVEIDYAQNGIRFNGGKEVVRQCRLARNGRGMITYGSLTIVLDSLAEQNQGTEDWGMGCYVSNNSHCEFWRCKALNNQGCGLRAINHSSLTIGETGEYSTNGQAGVSVEQFSRLYVFPGVAGGIRNNTGNGIVASGMAYVMGSSYCTITGNASPQILLSAGGASY